ncbi:enhanced serine sensitivity protein SseB C-terminal domain-containing protein [Acinetobacter sp. MB5]|uniref:enhanced serine sensitivity protein SseB C-terminal domain-containing protein n=1 Tax=Acinetobacter sp. MB5 TaxID=2069438 RepID=UPI001D0DAABD|nr:enhanced serine sensitivity protein SseB C-terminal domain-containing protein [Acinetobacter sp. MB5]
MSEQQLEQLLEKAAKEPAYRPEFLQQLLIGHIYCLGVTGQNTDPMQTTQIHLKAGDEIQLQKWTKADGSEALPFFLSLDTLQKSIEEEHSYLYLPTQQFFEMTMGDTLVLNPMSPYGKEFSPNEIRQLLQIDAGQVESYEVEQDTEVLLGQPAEYPYKMVTQLQKFLQTKPQVQAAYLALMHNPQRDAEPTLIIGLQLDAPQSLDQLIQQTGQVAFDSLDQPSLVDLTIIDDQQMDGLSRYMREETTPFYQREQPEKRRGILTRFFS